MQGYSKAIAAIAAAAIQLLANFGIEVSPNVLGIINSLVPVLGAVLVYAIPNKTE